MKTKNMRNIYLNSIIGFSLKLLLLILSLINRTIFINLLSIEYLGIAGLYTNIISVLGLADLGIYTAFMFSLYKPIANQDFELINNLIKYFSKIYKVIGIIVILLGLTFIPLLRYLVDAPNLSNHQIINYYIMFVLNSGLSYFNICKTTLLRADKKVFIVDLTTTGITILTYGLQIVFLYFTKSYYFYIIVQILMTIFTNILLTLITNKIYPYLKKSLLKNEGLTVDIKTNVKKNIKNVLLYKFCNIIINSTDNILISIILGTICVGVYSNYSLILITLNSFIFIIVNAVLPNIGEVYAKEDLRETYKSFKNITYFFNILSCFILSSLVCVFNDFISLWLKDESLLLKNFDVLLISVNFYISCSTNSLWMFRESTGHFKEVTFVLLINAFLNVILSILLGHYFNLGVGGIIIGTGLSKVLSILIYEPILLFRKVFNGEKIFEYYMKNIVYLFISSITLIISIVLCSLIESSIVNCFIKVMICFVVTIFIAFVFTFKFSETKYAIDLFKRSKV